MDVLIKPCPSCKEIWISSRAYQCGRCTKKMRNMPHYRGRKKDAR